MAEMGMFLDNVVKFKECWETFCNLVTKVSESLFGGSQRRSSHRRCSVKKMFLKVSQNSQESFRVSFLIKLQNSDLQFIKKATMA